MWDRYVDNTLREGGPISIRGKEPQIYNWMGELYGLVCRWLLDSESFMETFFLYKTLAQLFRGKRKQNVCKLVMNFSFLWHKTWLVILFVIFWNYHLRMLHSSRTLNAFNFENWSPDAYQQDWRLFASKLLIHYWRVIVLGNQDSTSAVSSFHLSGGIDLKEVTI